MTTALKIDPAAKTIEPISFDATKMRDIIGGTVTIAVRLGNNAEIYAADDIRDLPTPVHFWQTSLREDHAPIGGIGLLVGPYWEDHSGNFGWHSVSPETIDLVRRSITWLGVGTLAFDTSMSTVKVTDTGQEFTHIKVTTRFVPG